MHFRGPNITVTLSLMCLHCFLAAAVLAFVAPRERIGFRLSRARENNALVE